MENTTELNFVSLDTLLEDSISVASLATAIDDNGLHGWDRFGRFKHFPKDSDEAM